MKIVNKSKFKISLPLEIGKEKTDIAAFDTVYIDKPVPNVKAILEAYIGKYVEVDYDANEDVIKVIGIKAADVQVELSKFLTLDAEVVPNTATNKGLKFELTAGQDYVELKDNVIEAKAKGMAEVTISAEENADIKKVIKVQVIEANIIASEISVEKEVVEIEIGSQYELPVKILPEEASDKRYKLTSAHGGIVGVSKSKLVAKTVGETTIKISANSNPQLTKEVLVKVIEKA